MKNLYLLRHAKSSWDDFALKDFDRPLSTRGIQDAELMGNYFKSKRKVLDLVLSSPSKRTKETLEHFFNKTSQNIIFNETIYHTVNWYKNFYLKEDDIFQLTLNQNKDYTNSAISKGLSWTNAK